MLAPGSPKRYQHKGMRADHHVKRVSVEVQDVGMRMGGGAIGRMEEEEEEEEVE